MKKAVTKARIATENGEPTHGLERIIYQRANHLGTTVVRGEKGDIALVTRRRNGGRPLIRYTKSIHPLDKWLDRTLVAAVGFSLILLAICLS